MYLLDMYEHSDVIFTKENLQNGFKDIPNKNWRSQNINPNLLRAEVSKFLDDFFVDLEQKKSKKLEHFGDTAFKNQWEREVYCIPGLE